MPSPSPSPFLWLLLVLLVAAGVMALWTFYVWWKRDRYTRERFAFFSFSALSALGASFLTSLSLDTSPLGGLLFVLLDLWD